MYKWHGGQGAAMGCGWAHTNAGWGIEFHMKGQGAGELQARITLARA